MWERRRESGKRAAGMMGWNASLGYSALPARYLCQYLIPEDGFRSVSMPSRVISELRDVGRTGS